jgi:hypothetical protein
MDNDALSKVLSWVVGIDSGAAIEHVERLRSQSPGASNEALAARVFGAARWKATGVGMLTGLPSNPFVMLPSAVADLAGVLRIETEAVARVALIYDAAFFERPDAAWELLVPVFGVDTLSQFFREVGVVGTMGVTRQLVRQYLSKGTLKAFQKITLKYFGRKVTQKAILSKSLPVVGAVIGGGWNFGEVTFLRNRTIAYFENRPLSASQPVVEARPN